MGRKCSKFSYLAHELLRLKANKAKTTQEQTRIILTKHLIPWFKDKYIDEINQYEIDKYITTKSLKLKVYDHLKHLKSVFKLAQNMDMPVKRIEFKCPDAKPVRGKLFSRHELAKLLWFTRERISWDIRLQIRMAYCTGMRRGEICNFKFEYLNDRGWVYLPAATLKTKKTVDRAFPINPTVRRIIMARKKRSNGCPYLFHNSKGKPPVRNNASWQRLRKRSGILGRFHDLRHTHATWLLQLLDAKFVVKLLGMSEEVLSRYVHVPPALAEKAVKEAVRVELKYSTRTD